MTQQDDITNKSSNSPHAVSLDELAAVCATAKCKLSPAGLEQLAAYLELLMQWNKVINLVGAQSWQSAVLRLVADSFFLGKFLDNLPLSHSGTDGPRTWDLGAGAGLPGIPLRMVWDKGEYCMVEAREKRAVFLSTVLARTRLPRTTVFRGRVEDFFVRQSQAGSGTADLIVSRAFMPWERLLPLVRPVLAPQGMVVFLASESLPVAPHEVPEGFTLHAQEAYTIAGRKRWFWAIAKV